MSAVATTFPPGWTVEEWRLTDEYLRISMNEDVSIYIGRRPDKEGRWWVDYYFYGTEHTDRASDFLARNPGGVFQETGGRRARSTATTVRLFHDKDPMSYPFKGVV